MTAVPASTVPSQPGSLRANWRIFWNGGRLSYAALFNWAQPSIYIPTLLGAPTFQILFFAALGSYATGMDPEFFAIGNAVQVCSMSGIYGMTMAVANERWFGTLPALMASPANRAALFGGPVHPVHRQRVPRLGLRLRRSAGSSSASASTPRPWASSCWP